MYDIRREEWILQVNPTSVSNTEVIATSAISFVDHRHKKNEGVKISGKGRELESENEK